MTLWRGAALAVSMVIGSGLLGLPGLVLEIGNPYEAVLGWILISLAVFPLIRIFATLGLKFPTSAGLARYAEAAVGPWGGYAVAYLVFGSVPGIPALTLIGAEYVQRLFSLPFDYVPFLAVLVVTAMTLFNLAGVRAVSLVNYAALGVLVLLLLVISIFNLDFFVTGLSLLPQALSGEGSVEFERLWTIAALLFWAFLGWGSFSFSLGELESPEKNVPRVYWLSFAVVVFIYLLLAFTTAGAEVSGVSLKGASGLAGLVELTPGGDLLLLLIVIVLVANASSWNFTASRLLYSAANEGIFPASLGKLSGRSIPVKALLALYAVSLLLIAATYVFKVPISAMVLIVDQNFVFLYAFVVLSYWKLETGWKRWVFTGLSLVSLSFLVSGFSWWVLYPLLLVGVGYWRSVKKKGSKEESGEV
ncbi:amino acid permease [Methanosarcina sp. KYL-1]|uniref:APC family permease n=1 Tax=Methanosarcina sp. KYL-1 TaxID=2602068 RepID=UPI002100E856